MKAGMSDDAELFIKAEEAPASLIDQGHSPNSTTHAANTHMQVHTNGPVWALLICYVDHRSRSRGASKQMALWWWFTGLTVKSVNADPHTVLLYANFNNLRIRNCCCTEIYFVFFLVHPCRQRSRIDFWYGFGKDPENMTDRGCHDWLINQLKKKIKSPAFLRTDVSLQSFFKHKRQTFNAVKPL